MEAYLHGAGCCATLAAAAATTASGGEKPRRLKPIDAFSASSTLYLILMDFFKAQGQKSVLLLRTPTKKKKKAALHLKKIHKNNTEEVTHMDPLIT